MAFDAPLCRFDLMNRPFDRRLERLISTLCLALQIGERLRGIRRVIREKPGSLVAAVVIAVANRRRQVGNDDFRTAWDIELRKDGRRAVQGVEGAESGSKQLQQLFGRSQ